MYGRDAQLTSGRPAAGKDMLAFDAEVRKYAKENGIDTNPQKINARKNMVTDWESTKANSTGSSLAAIDTVTQHMDEYEQAIKDYNTI